MFHTPIINKPHPIINKNQQKDASDKTITGLQKKFITVFVIKPSGNKNSETMIKLVSDTRVENGQ